ncbi:hypothetical protein [Bifidobacterium saguinibicoloris]|uniref:hypothetical protein n=1 Tax=Bifidobacterium saguinibicoloris TaxID=2834433 RepID=UPI001C55F599|nr:hypothetical protein [Bifidobacterium saguinibicoloris]MBW3080206.1 hypothetical protein [Bifidobacterium saguinibicoloris]
MGTVRKMQLMKLSAEHAFMPEAARTVQRAIVIRAGGRPRPSRDWWAALFDRGTMAARYRADPHLPDEGYLHVLIEGYLGAIAMERQDTLLLQEVLRCRALELIEEYRGLQEGLPALLRSREQAREAVARTDGDGEPATAAERYESPDAVARRRRRERERALRDGESMVAAARRRLAALRGEYVTLRDTFWFHQGAFLTRAVVVRSYYMIRMDDFVRRTLRRCLREGEPPVLPDFPCGFEEPEPFPVLPDMVSGERPGADEGVPGTDAADGADDAGGPDGQASSREEAMRRGAEAAAAAL